MLGRPHEYKKASQEPLGSIRDRPVLLHTLVVDRSEGGDQRGPVPRPHDLGVSLKHGVVLTSTPASTARPAIAVALAAADEGPKEATATRTNVRHGETTLTDPLLSTAKWCALQGLLVHCGHIPASLDESLPKAVRHDASGAGTSMRPAPPWAGGFTKMFPYWQCRKSSAGPTTRDAAVGSGTPLNVQASLNSRPGGRETSKINHERIEAPHLREDAMTSSVDRLLTTSEGRVRVAVTIVRPQTGTTWMAVGDSQLQKRVRAGRC